MLRAAVIAIASILACTGAALIAHGVRMPGWQALALGGVLLLGTLFERWRYRGPEQRKQGSWENTGERFQDPSSGETIQVQFDPRTGERRYVKDDSARV